MHYNLNCTIVCQVILEEVLVWGKGGNCNFFSQSLLLYCACSYAKMVQPNLSIHNKYRIWFERVSCHFVSIQWFDIWCQWHRIAKDAVITCGTHTKIMSAKIVALNNCLEKSEFHFITCTTLCCVFCINTTRLFYQAYEWTSITKKRHKFVLLATWNTFQSTKNCNALFHIHFHQVFCFLTVSASTTISDHCTLWNSGGIFVL